MCGRYSLSTPEDLLQELFELKEAPSLEPRYNIAPTQEAAVVRRLAADGPRSLGALRWGLVPYWAKSPDVGGRMINARSETVSERPAFSESFARRRCLVPADGFYEWKGEGRAKQAYRVRLRGERPFAFAGLWDRWRGGEGPSLETFTILTSDPHPVVAPIHDRMPVILPSAAWERWLDPEEGDPDRLQTLLGPWEGDDLEAYPVSSFVNKPRNDSPRCVEPLASGEQRSLF